MNDILNQNIIIADLETTGTDCFFDQILSRVFTLLPIYDFGIYMNNLNNEYTQIIM